MATMTEAEKVVPKQKTPPPPLKEELMAIEPVAQAHRLAIEAQGVEDEEHARVVSRAIERAKRGRVAAEKKELDELGVKHRRGIREIQRARCSTLQESDEDLENMVWEHKELVVQSMGLDEDITRMQMELWLGFCVICRARDGAWLEHDWRACCHMWADEAKAVQEGIEGIRANRANWEREGKVQHCSECRQTWEDCWMLGIKGSGKTPQERQCRFRGAMVAGMAAILALGGRRVQEWEGSGGRLRGEIGRSGDGNQGRLGYRAIGRTWRRFGWLGLMDLRNVKIAQVGTEYRSRLERAVQGGAGLSGGDVAAAEWQLVVRSE